ncbi:ABC transporter ATP-binding protein [Niallia nealsonii]|uniref:ABC transporter ATP-binding protein n=1 Tax=Niallia nealsonii TaxID=115979 RepID=A0A2N0Z4K9_9BACI|nr:ABC transporter ATP-binding protein [Niallia nealsonii]PKG24443.1 ABC transporter ATP-binding protein [Niallia nealsonii]
MIHFENVTKKYGKETALSNINLTLEKGKIYGLIGANGSGKSTFLKMIAGLVRPSIGNVFVMNRQSNRKIAEKVSYLTELDLFYEGFTVKEMINYSASQFSDFQINKAEELIEFMKLDGAKKIKALSKGNRGRLKLILSLSRDVPILLMDEPFSGLDPMVRESIVKSLLTFIDFEKQTVIIATHEIVEIEPILDEVIAINNGQIVASYNVDQLREEKGQSVLEWMKENLNSASAK